MRKRRFKPRTCCRVWEINKRTMRIVYWMWRKQSEIIINFDDTWYCPVIYTILRLIYIDTSCHNIEPYSVLLMCKYFYKTEPSCNYCKYSCKKCLCIERLKMSNYYKTRKNEQQTYISHLISNIICTLKDDYPQWKKL